MNENVNSETYKSEYFATEHVVYHDNDGGHLGIIANVHQDDNGNSNYDVFVYDYSKVVKNVSFFDNKLHDNHNFMITYLT